MKPAKKRRMGSTGRWLRFWGVAAAYGVTFLLLRRAYPGIVTSPWFVVAAMIFLEFQTPENTLTGSISGRHERHLTEVAGRSA